MSHNKPQYPSFTPAPVSVPQTSHRRGGFAFSPRLFLVAVLIAALLVVFSQIPLGDLGGGAKPGTYQRAQVGAVLPKGETGCPARFTITITHTPSGLVQSIEVHQYVVTPEGDLIAELADHCGLEYRGSGQFNTWTILSK